MESEGDAIPEENANMHLVTTWITPVLRTALLCVAALSNIVLQHADDSTGKWTVAIVLIHVILIIDTFAIAHKQVACVIRRASYLCWYWIVYSNMCKSSPWAYKSDGWIVFGTSVCIIASVYMLDQVVRTGAHTIPHRGWILYVLVLLLVPNAVNTIGVPSVWESGFRLFLFIFSTWFCMLVSISSKATVNYEHFFNQFMWVLLVHRYLIPLVGIIWMRALLQMSAIFSARQTKRSPQPTTQYSQGEQRFVETSADLRNDDVELDIQDTAKKPTTLFQTIETVTPGATSAPTRRRFLKKWPEGATAKSKSKRRSNVFGKPLSTASNEDQVLKLQQLALGVDAV